MCVFVKKREKFLACVAFSYVLASILIVKRFLFVNFEISERMHETGFRLKKELSH